MEIWLCTSCQAVLRRSKDSFPAPCRYCGKATLRRVSEEELAQASRRVRPSEDDSTPCQRGEDCPRWTGGQCPGGYSC